MKRTTSVALVIAAVAIGLAVRAEEDVPLYTNADLDRMFGKSPKTEPAKPYANTDADWQRVQSFLDREYARQDAQRRYEDERSAMTYDQPERNPYSGWPAGAWWGSYPYYGGYYRTNPYGGYGHGRGGPKMTSPAPGARGSRFTPRHGSEFRMQSGGFRGHAR